VSVSVRLSHPDTLLERCSLGSQNFYFLLRERRDSFKILNCFRKFERDHSDQRSRGC